MSVPAQTLPRPSHAPIPAPSRRRKAPPAAHLRLERGSLRAPVRPRLRRRAGFAVLASTVVAIMVLGLVVMNTLLAQGSFRIDDLAGHVDDLSETYLRLTHDAARLSAPDRIAAWARRHGMRLPDEIHILHVPVAARAVPVGESEPPDRGLLALKAVVGGQP